MFPNLNIYCITHQFNKLSLKHSLFKPSTDDKLKIQDIYLSYLYFKRESETNEFDLNLKAEVARCHLNLSSITSEMIMGLNTKLQQVPQLKTKKEIEDELEQMTVVENRLYVVFEGRICFIQGAERIKNRLIQLKQELNKQRSMIDKNKPSMEMRIPERLDSSAYHLSSSRREFSILTQEQYLQIKKIQLKLNLEHEKSTGIWLSQQVFPEMSIPYPVFIGHRGNVIVLYKGLGIKPIGEGSYGEVFYGQDVDSLKIVAVKCQYGKKGLDGSEVLDVKKEELVLNKLDQLIDHLIITSNIGGDKQKGWAAITVQELAWGLDYATWKDNYSLHPALLLCMSIQFLKELHNVHLKGYIHRDPKIQNIIWDHVKRVGKLVDHGLTIRQGQNGAFVRDKYFTGICPYMAPEVNSDGLWSVSSDIYTAGFTLTELFSKYDLYNNADQYKSQILSRVLHNGILPIIVFNAPDLFQQQATSPEMQNLYNLIRSMLDINPANRPSLPNIIEKLEEVKDNLMEGLFPGFKMKKNELIKARCLLLTYKCNLETRYGMMGTVKDINQLISQIEYMLQKEKIFEEDIKALLQAIKQVLEKNKKQSFDCQPGSLCAIFSSYFWKNGENNRVLGEKRVDDFIDNTLSNVYEQLYTMVNQKNKSITLNA